MRRRALIAATLLLALPMAYLLAANVVLDISLTPKRASCVTPAATALHGTVVEATTLSSTTDGTKLAAWIVAPGREQGVVLVHGLDSCGWHGTAPDVAMRYVDAGFSVVIFDLRGQGASEGDALGLGYLERGDVEAAVRLLQTKGSTRIGVHGSSYGAATALLATAMIKDVRAVVADSAFADVRDLMDAELERRVGGSVCLRPGVVLAGRLFHGLDLAAIAPVAAVPQIGPRPISFLHGALDDRIPVEHARRLKAAARGPGDELWILEGAGHTVALEKARDEYFARTVGFLAKHLQE
jgi:dipeptidyl aminopeptidase/acylaminoacyl peptidase